MLLKLMENETIFEIEVSEEDYNKALNDIRFAQSLLNHAKIMQKVNQNNNSEDCATQNPDEIIYEERRNFDEINEEERRYLDECANEEEPLTLRHNEELDTEIAGEGSKWNYKDTLALISTMENYLQDINHSNPKKKKDAWLSISSELESLNVLKTADMCKVKWKNLLRSYSNCKSNRTKTGRKPIRFVYFDQMDQLVGHKPNFSSPHSFNVLSPNDSTESSPAREDTTSIEVTNESVERTPTHKRKQQTVGIIELKKRLLQSKVNKVEIAEKQREAKLKLLERKIQVDERKCDLLEKYIKLKEQNQNS